MIHRARTLVTVLALTAAPMVAHARRRPPPTPADAFFNQDKYTYCDAKMLSGLWKQSMGDAKTRIGMKIQAGGPSVKFLDEELDHARGHAKKDSAARCSYMDIGLSYDDVAKLARLWKTSEPDAKALIETKVLAGEEHMVRDMAKHAKPIPEDGISTFLKQDRFTYCDAKLIAGLWKMGIEEGKAWIGEKLQAKAPNLVEAQLVKARADAKRHPENRCEFGETEFGYDDAVKLAKLWKVDVTRAKTMVEQKVNDGHSAMVRQQLKR
jgi:hypothetical protein